MIEKTLLLVRHGETDLNKNHLVQGVTDEPINQKGIDQARSLSNYFKENGISFDDAYCSPLKRAYETLEILTVIPYKTIDDLRERNFGTFENKHVSLIPNLPFGDYFTTYGGESDIQVFLRMNQAIKTIMDSSKGHTILIVSHGAAIRSVMAGWAGKEESNNMILNNCSAAEYHYIDHKFIYIETIH